MIIRYRYAQNAGRVLMMKQHPPDPFLLAFPMAFCVGMFSLEELKQLEFCLVCLCKANRQRSLLSALGAMCNTSILNEMQLLRCLDVP